MKCPGQDTRFWRPGDVFEVACTSCGRPVEFFKDDRSRRCPSCGARFRNPRIDLGCAEWCPYASECVDFHPGDGAGPGGRSQGGGR